MKATISLLLGVACLILAGCGQTSTTSTSTPITAVPPAEDATALLQRAVAGISASSPKISAQVSVTADGLPRLTKQAVDGGVQLDIASLANVSAIFGGNIDGKLTPIQVVTTGGTDYVSTDNGKTWTTSTALTGNPLIVAAPIEFLLSASTARNNGYSVTSGIRTTEYDAAIDKTKILPFLIQSLSETQPNYKNFASVLSKLSLSGGSLSVFVADNGRVMKETGYVDAVLPAAALQSGAPGNVHVHETISATFLYGPAVVVTAPPGAPAASN